MGLIVAHFFHKQSVKLKLCFYLACYWCTSSPTVQISKFRSSAECRVHCSRQGRTDCKKRCPIFCAVNITWHSVACRLASQCEYSRHRSVCLYWNCKRNWTRVIAFQGRSILMQLVVGLIWVESDVWGEWEWNISFGRYCWTIEHNSQSSSIWVDSVNEFKFELRLCRRSCCYLGTD